MTTVSTAGAAVSFTTPVPFAPPMIVVGATVTDATFSGVTVTLPEPVSPFNAPVIVATAETPTTLVVIGNVAIALPTGTTTVAGTTTFALSLVSVTVVAAVTTSVSVTVPTEATPPTTGDGAAVILPTVRIRTARVPVAVVPFALADMSTFRVAVTADVLTVNVANVLPLGTITDAGTVAAAFEEVNCTVIPAAGAAPVNVTVPMEAFPPRTAAGENVTVDGRAA